MGKLWPSLLGLASVGVLSLAANASEIYPPAGPAPGPYAAGIPPRGLILTWTGFYIGAHLGGGWGDLHVTDVDGFAAPAGTRLGLSPDGFFGGGTFGYNFQAGDFLYGFEADFGGMSTGASRLIPAGATTRVGIEDSIYGDVTGRLGYACGPLLYYAKGGFAFLDTNRTFSTASASTARDIGTFTGWTAGAGIEWMIDRNWSLKLEYLHFDFGNEDFLVNGGYRFREDLTIETVKGGFNFRLYNEYVPLK